MSSFFTSDQGAAPFKPGRASTYKSMGDTHGNIFGNEERTDDNTGSRRNSLSSNPLLGAGSAIGGGGGVPSSRSGYNSARSQIVFGEGTASEDNVARKSKFAGMTNRSSISFANFGGDGVDDRFSSGKASGAPLQQQHQQRPAQKTAPQASLEQSVPLVQGVSAAQADQMIREIAELRVRNQELEDFVTFLSKKLAVYESPEQHGQQ